MVTISRVPSVFTHLDALLAAGEARFDDVADRIETALEKRGISEVDTWLEGVGGDLDRALAETVTLAADDVLLDALLARLDPLARQLLLGAAVYRLPVDDIGLQWQVSEYQEPEPAPERESRMTDTAALLTRARRENLTSAEVGVTADMLEQWDCDWAYLRRPPLAVLDGFVRACDSLLRLGLLAPVSAGPDADPQYLVHRWTATALATRREDAVGAHRRAAQYWQWREHVWPQDRTADITELIEARHHRYEAGDTATAVSITYTINNQLHVWGAWTWEEDLCIETLSWLTERTYDRAAFLHQLGIRAELRGDYDHAEQQYRAALTINEEVGGRAGIANGYYHLGSIAERRGEYQDAEQRCRAALAIYTELDDRVGIAASYHQLGVIALIRGDHSRAEQQFSTCLTISNDLGDRAKIAITHHQLGIVAERRGDYARAEQQYHTSLTIKEELGDRDGIAQTYGQLGALFTTTGRVPRGVALTLDALSLHSTLGSPEVENDLQWLSTQRLAVGDAEFRRILAEHLVPESIEDLIDALSDPDDR